MEDFAGPAHGAGQLGAVADIGHLHGHAVPMRRLEPLHILLNTGTGEAVIHDHPPPLREQSIGQVRADKPGTPGD